MNHEESNESRDESRESTPAAPGLRLGFPRFASERFPPIHSRGAKAPGVWPPARSLCRDLLLFRPDRPRGTNLGLLCSRLKLYKYMFRRIGVIEFSGLQTGTVRHFPQAAIWNGRHKLFLPLIYVCSGTGQRDNLACIWCFHIQCFISHWVAHVRFLYCICNFNVLYSTIYVRMYIYIMY